MISPYAIWIISRCEARLLWRSWAFRLSAGFCLFILFFFNLAISAPFSNAPHHFRSLSGNLPLINIKLLNLYLGLIAAFLTTEFIKRDRQQDTIQTVLVHSFTNVDYLVGKVLGVGTVFAALQLFVLVAVGVNHRFFVPTAFAWQPYLLFTLVATLPTLIFTIGLSGLLVTLLRSQALVFVLMLGISMLFLIVLGHQFFYYFDIFAFWIPLIYSDFVGLGNLQQLLLVRGTHLLFGLGCIALTALLSSRLRQSLWANLVVALVALGCLGGATWTSVTYLQEKWAARDYREELRAASRKASALPAPSITAYQLEVEHVDRQLTVVAHLSVVNANSAPLDSLLFTLNPGLQVGEVTADGSPLSFLREEHLLRVALPAVLAPGDSCRLQISYGGTIDERFCYLDIDKERYEGRYQMFLYSMPKAYAFVTSDFLHLTPESAWYPLGGVPPGTAFPAAGRRDYARYRLSIRLPREWTAISQGSVEVDSTKRALTYRFETEEPVPQVSLTAGRYEQRQLSVDDVTYTLAFLPGHDYFDAYLDSVGPVLPELIREIRNDYEAALGLEYPHRRLSLVEVPIQFFAYRRLWTIAQEAVQPEIIFLPEMGTLCEGCDFKRMKRRSTRSQERANQAESTEEIQSDYLRTFAMLDLLGMQDAGTTDLSQNSSLETGYKILPNYLSFATHLSSTRWPVLNYAFESYFRERVAPPQNTNSRQWHGLTGAEQANLALKEHGLAELLDDADLEGRIRETAINVKGRQLLLLFAAALGPERFAEQFTAFVEENRYRHLSEIALIEFIRGLGDVDPEKMIDAWYSAAELPGYQVERTDSYLVRDGERTRTQVELDIANPTGVDGLVEVNFRYRQTELIPWWERRRTQSDYAQMISLPAGTRKKIGFLLDQPAAEMILDTYVSRNIPSLIHVPFREEQKIRKRAEPFSGERTELLESDAEDKAIEYLVDNEDEGFEVLEAEQANWLRRFLVDLFHLKKRAIPYIGMRWWHPPGTWEATTDRRFFGRFVLSGYYKKSGDGRSKVAWRTEIGQEGDYDLYFYCGLLDELRRGRSRRGGERSLNLLVYHEDGVEDLDLDVQEAEEGWNHLGTYRLAAGPAHVELSDRGTGRCIIADAVKWVKKSEQ